MDGENFMIMVVEDASVPFDKDSKSTSGSERSSESSEEEGEDMAPNSISVVDWKPEEAEDGKKRDCNVEATNLQRRYNDVRAVISKEDVENCTNSLGKETNPIMEKEGYGSDQSLKSRESKGYISESISRVAGTVEKDFERKNVNEVRRVSYKKDNVESEGDVSNRFGWVGPPVIGPRLLHFKGPSAILKAGAGSRPKENLFSKVTCKKEGRWSDLSE